AQKPLSVCPIVSFAKGWGANVFSTSSTSTTLFQAGANVGFVATKSGQATIVPTVGLSFNHLGRSTTDTFAGRTQTFDSGGSFGTLQFGAGFIFNDRFSLTPAVTVPFHLEGLETSFSIVFGARIGS